MTDKEQPNERWGIKRRHDMVGNDVTVINLGTGREESHPDIAAKFLGTLSGAITRAGGEITIEEVPEIDEARQPTLHLVTPDEAEVIQLFPDTNQGA